jgi:hypothetical protein
MNADRVNSLRVAVAIGLLLLTGSAFAQLTQTTTCFDGCANKGNPHFYFRPPLAADRTYSGTFSPSFAPVVEVCEVVNGKCAYPPLVRFTTQGSGSDVVRVESADQQYIVNWKTGKLNSTSSSCYQINVSVNGLLMGFATLTGDMKNRTIPIKFRLEMGANDWGVVGPQGATLSFADGLVMVIPAGALKEYVAISKGPLHAAELQALFDSRAYRSHEKRVLGGFSAKPDGLKFNVPITIRMPILHATGIPVQAEMSSDLSRYWIAPTNLIYDARTNVVEFTIKHFSEHAVPEVLGEKVVLPPGCSGGRIKVVAQGIDYSQGSGCQIMGDRVEVYFLDCGEPPPMQGVQITELTPDCGNIKFTVSISPASTTVKACRSAHLIGKVTDQDGNLWDIPLIWRSNSLVVTVDPHSGAITGNAIGEAEITAILAGPSTPGTARVQVESPSALKIDPAVVTCHVGDMVTLKAVDEYGYPYLSDKRDDAGKVTIEGVEWKVETGSSVSLVSADLLTATANFRAVEIGTSVIQSSGCLTFGRATIEVVPAEPPSHNVTFQTEPPGLSVTLDGESQVTPYQVDWMEGTTHTISTRSPQFSSIGTQCIFDRWSDGGEESHSVIALNGSMSYTAAFLNPYLIEWSITSNADTAYVNTGAYGVNKSGYLSVRQSTSGRVIVGFPAPGTNQTELRVAESIISTSVNASASSNDEAWRTGYCSRNPHNVIWEMKEIDAWASGDLWKSMFEEYLVGTKPGIPPSLTIDFAHQIINWKPFIPVQPSTYIYSRTLTWCDASWWCGGCPSTDSKVEVYAGLVPLLDWWPCDGALNSQYPDWESVMRMVYENLMSSSRVPTFTVPLSGSIHEVFLYHGGKLVADIGARAISDIAAFKTGLDFGVEPARERIPLPTTFSLSPNYPNPFNPSTTIEYALPFPAHVKLNVFNSLGQIARDLVDGRMEAGYYRVRFDATGLSSGVYFYRMQAGTFVETRKLLLVR